MACWVPLFSGGFVSSNVTVGTRSYDHGTLPRCRNPIVWLKMRPLSSFCVALPYVCRSNVQCVLSLKYMKPAPPDGVRKEDWVPP